MVDLFYFFNKEQCQQMEQPIKRKAVPIIGNEKTNTFTTSPYLLGYFIQYFTETIRFYSNLICFGRFIRERNNAGYKSIRFMTKSGAQT